MDEPRILIVTGLPGTGKTTLARAIGARYRVPVIGKDIIKEPLLDVLGARDAAESRKLSDASFAALFALARECGAGHVSLVLEGNFRPGEHEPALRNALPSSTTAIAQILCSVDEPERLARLANRRDDSLRHPGHRDAEQAVSSARPRGDTFLDLPGERFVHTGRNDLELLAGVDRWWNSRTI